MPIIGQADNRSTPNIYIYIYITKKERKQNYYSRCSIVAAAGTMSWKRCVSLCQFATDFSNVSFEQCRVVLVVCLSPVTNADMEMFTRSYET